MFYLINGTINGYLYLVLGKPGKLRVYHGSFSLAQGLDAPYVTRYTYAFAVRFRVEEMFSYSLSLTLAVVLDLFTTLLYVS